MHQNQFTFLKPNQMSYRVHVTHSGIFAHHIDLDKDADLENLQTFLDDGDAVILVNDFDSLDRLGIDASKVQDLTGQKL